jgi:hypothetical protein
MGNKEEGDVCDSWQECESRFCIQGHCELVQTVFPQWVWVAILIIVVALIGTTVLVFCCFHRWGQQVEPSQA